MTGSCDYITRFRCSLRVRIRRAVTAVKQIAGMASRNAGYPWNARATHAGTGTERNSKQIVDNWNLLWNGTNMGEQRVNRWNRGRYEQRQIQQQERNAAQVGQTRSVLLRNRTGRTSRRTGGFGAWTNISGQTNASQRQVGLRFCPASISRLMPSR